MTETKQPEKLAQKNRVWPALNAAPSQPIGTKDKQHKKCVIALGTAEWSASACIPATTDED